MDWSRFDGPLANAIRRFLRPAPDPWPAEIAASLGDETARPLCLNCLFPQGPHTWFCPRCGYPIGDYVVLMPYLQNFVLGEVLRRGVMGEPERRRSVQAFLVVFSITQYAIFAPIYWFWMIRRAQGRPICTERRIELQLGQPPAETGGRESES